MNRDKAFRFGLVAAMGLTIAACTITDTQPPPLQGPSELALSLTLTASPDVLSQDGASQSQITIQARDAYGQPVANLPIRAEIVVSGTFVDFGSLSARTLVTGTNGRAQLTYTAPSTVVGAPNAQQVVSIQITPNGTDAASQLGRLIDIRLVPPGVIVAGGPTPSFTYSPAAPVAFQDVGFTSTSTAAIGSAIVNYAWNFGDGGTASGPVVSHRFSAGSYSVTLTVTDSSGLSASSFQTVSIGAGNLPTALFTTSPSTGALVGQAVFFNASTSTPGLGRSIVRYDWDFGTGSTGSGVSVSKVYDTVGTYTVTLKVTDDVGQTNVRTATLAIATNPGSTVTARFTFTPSPGVNTQPVTFDGSSSSTTSGSIIRYEWNFGDGTSIQTTYAPTATIQHTFPAVGAYSVTLTAFDSNGNSDPQTTTVTIQ